jgi:hypothetical protein
MLSEYQKQNFIFADVNLSQGFALLHDSSANIIGKVDFNSVEDFEKELGIPIIDFRDQNGAMTIHVFDDAIKSIAMMLDEDPHSQYQDDIDRIALKFNLPLDHVYDLINSEFRKLLQKEPIWLGSSLVQGNMVTLELHSTPQLKKLLGPK